MLEFRRLLAFGIAHITPDLSDTNRLFQVNTRNVEFSTSGLTQPNQLFHFGFSKGSDDTPSDGSFLARGFDDRIIAGDWTGNGFTLVGVAQNTDETRPPNPNAPLRFLLDTDRDTSAEYAFQFGIASDIPVVGNFDGRYGDDIGVVRDSGGGLEWYVTTASRNPGSAFPKDDSVRAIDQWFRFGLTGDIALTGSFDGDDIDDLVVVRNVDGAMQWLFHLSAKQPYPTTGVVVSHDQTVTFGPAGSIPVVGDWNEDGQDDIGFVTAEVGQVATWTLQTFNKGGLVFGPSITIPKNGEEFGRMQEGQTNVFLTGNWASNYFTGGDTALVSGPNSTGNLWSNPSVWSNGTLPVDGDTVVIAQASEVQITFDQGSFHGSVVTQNPLTVSGGSFGLTAGSSVGSLTVSGTGQVEINAQQNFSSVSLDGGTIIIGYSAATNPFGTSASISVLSGGTILSAAIPENVPLTGTDHYTLANTFSIGGALTIGNGVSTAADAEARERASYLLIAGLIEGAGSVRKTGKGTVLVTGENTYTGLTSIDDGELIAAAATALGATSGATQVNGGRLGILPPLENPFVLVESITIGSGGNVNLRHRASLSGTVTLESNSLLQVEPDSSLLSSIVVNGPATLEVIAPFANTPVGTTTTLAAPIAGAGDLNWLIPIGFVADVLSPGSRTGATRIRSGGTLQLSTADAIPTGEALELLDQSTLNLNGNSLQVSSLTGNGTINLGSSAGGLGSLIVQNTQATTFAGTISGEGSLTKRGSGVLTLAGLNDFTGVTAVEDGVLTTSTNESLSNSSPIVIRTGGTLSLGASNESIPSIDNQGVLRAGGSLLVLAGSLNNSGSIDLQGSLLTAQQLILTGGTISDSLVGGRIATSADLELLSGQIDVPISSNGGLSKTTAGSVALYSTLNYAGPTTVNDGTLVVGVSNAIPSTSIITISAPGTLQLFGSSQRFSSLLGDGNVSLSATPSFTSLLVLEPTTELAFSGTVTGPGDLIKRGTGRQTLTGLVSLAGNVSVEAGELVLSGASAQLLSVDVRGGGTLSTSSPNSTISGISIDSGGTAIISSTSSTIDRLTVNGLVEVNESGSIVRQVIIGTNGILRMRGALAASPSMTIAIDGGTIELETNEPFIDAPISVASGGATFVAKLATGGSTFNSPIALNSNAVATFDWVGAGSPAIGFEYRGAITGLGSLRKRGENFLNLAGASSFNGPVDVEQGELRLGVANALPANVSVNVASGALLNLSTNTVRFGSIAGLGSIQGDSASQLIVGGTNVASTFDGTLTGSLSLIKEGTSTLTLTNGNTYNGSTTTTNGILRLQGGSAIPDASPITVSGGTLDFNNTDETIASLSSSGAVVLGSGAVRVHGSFFSTGTLDAATGTLEFTGSSEQQLSVAIAALNNVTHSGSGSLLFVGALTIRGVLANQAGTLDINGVDVISDQLHVDDGSVIDGGGSGSLRAATLFDLRSGTVSARLNGLGNLTKSAGGTVILSGNNLYSGTTTIDAGTLRLGSDASLNGLSRLVISGPGTLDLNDHSVSASSLVGTGQILLGLGVLTLDLDGDSEFGGTISGAGGFVKEGLGKLSLSGSGDFTGTLNVQSGTLQANGTFPNADTSIQSGGSLQGTGTLGDVTISDGGILRPGNSPGKMAVNNLILAPGSRLIFEIAGPIAGGQYDQITVNDQAILNGIIEVQLVDGYLPSVADLFDLILYSSRSGSPSIALPSLNGTQILREQFTTNALRISIGLPAPPPQNSDNSDLNESKPALGLVASPSGAQQFAGTRENASSESILLVSFVSNEESDSNVDASEWFERSPEYIPIEPTVQDEAVAIEIVVDVIFAEESFADLSSLTSDVQPYAAGALESPKPWIIASTQEERDVKDVESFTVLYFSIVAGTAFIVSGLSLLLATLLKPRQKTRDDDSPVASPSAVKDASAAQSLKPLREMSVKEEGVTAKGITHE